MNRRLYLIVCIVIIVNLVACSKGVTIKSPVYPDSILFDDYNSKLAIRDKNPVDGSFIGSLNDFSYSSGLKILNRQSKNLCYSPLSLYMALALVGTGANGATQEEIFFVLGISGKGKDFLSKQNSNLFRLLYTDNKIGKLKIANSLWLQKGINFKETFMTNAVNNFYASLYSVDFTDNSSAQLMSKWISESTNGILTPKINLEPEQIMSIINTIYFKDEWVDRFDEGNTKPDTFYLGDGNRVKCDFMNMTYGVHMYVKGNGFTSSSLSLKNSGSMIFILPDKGVSIDELFSTPEKTALLFKDENSKNGKVIFKIPKFSFGNDLNMNSMLKTMGITSAFESNADFTGITDSTAFISNIEQQTHISIDEKGVEAAAFTQIQYCGSAQPNETVAEMILDRPFIFAIKSNQGAILFLGIVNNPVDK